jgi:hypothetical protein
MIQSVVTAQLPGLSSRQARAVPRCRTACAATTRTLIEREGGLGYVRLLPLVSQ